MITCNAEVVSKTYVHFRKDGDSEFMNIISNELANEVRLSLLHQAVLMLNDYCTT